ncbi:BZ3500_MvSof-1268-A1-R1_Chr1-3g02231 [Microbotryum saponariae]|uniref:BZ3500_MvSof-1268-A1-R1_Chr1-3g02231 protein n=1 Tax=Microbotryum saponariae TaxID=289078 RepID=A0A2X0KPD0_9BASI|nr:BZ3500_MvSof-1268-A1-R1_Chr1-3g02231 [Microbotryum saponariae]SCZ95719.1 BZ3501_MvSof-1269-A2-R1_Chr1-3g01834 [Microbotryum saponariae]
MFGSASFTPDVSVAAGGSSGADESTSRARTTSTASSKKTRALSILSSVSTRISSSLNGVSRRASMNSGTRASKAVTRRSHQPASGKENIRNQSDALAVVKPKEQNLHGDLPHRTEALDDYRERSASFSRSSPELRSIFNPSLQQLCEVTVSPFPIKAPTSCAQTSVSSKASTSSALAGTSLHSRFSLDISDSSPATSADAHRDVAVAEALAKLTAAPQDTAASAHRLAHRYTRSISDAEINSLRSNSVDQLKAGSWQSSTASASPSAIIAFEINARGRQLRPKSIPPPSASAGGPKSSLEVPVSRFTEDFTRASQPSLESRNDSRGPSVTFSDRPRLSAASGDKDRGTPGPHPLYSLRRGAESAVDFLSVVEEDDATNIHPQLHSDARSNRRSSKRLSSEAAYASSSLEALSRNVLAGAVYPGRRSFDEATAVRPSFAMYRSLSASSIDESIQEDDDSSSHSAPNITSVHHLGGRVGIPRGVSLSKLQPLTAPTQGVCAQASNTSPVRPRQHQRWRSEVVLEKVDGNSLNPHWSRGSTLSSEGSLAAASTRFSSDESMDGRPTRIARTKLVLRENGRPALTYVGKLLSRSYTLDEADHTPSFHQQLGECIGKGQFGSVYRALNLNSGRVVAVKRISLAGKTDEEIEQLSSEVAVLQRLEHPSVVKYEGLVKTEHYLNLVLEYVENGSLQKTIKHFGELPEPLVASYVVKILAGLEYLHSMHVVHCDLKAANILSTKHGNIKLSDFGTSLVTTTMRKDDHEAYGTPNWMAPEVIELRGATTASDIWSLGCTIIELIDCGRPPYYDHNSMSAMFHIVTDEHPPIPDRCSAELCDFLHFCFAKEPADRAAAKELLEHIWLQKNWSDSHNTQVYDSIPFRRRNTMKDHAPSPLGTDLPFDLPAPLPERENKSIPLVQSPRATTFIDGDTPLPILKRETTTTSVHNDVAIRTHLFVKTTFSKAIDCRLCDERTKRQAVLCSQCGLVAHIRCAEFAPECDLRSLLEYQAPKPRGPRTSTYSVVRPESPSMAFNLGEKLPFIRCSKRPTAGAMSSSSSLPLAATTPLSPMKTTPALRSFVGLIPTNTGNTVTNAIKDVSVMPTLAEPRGPIIIDQVERTDASRGQSGLRRLGHRRVKSAQPSRSKTSSDSDCILQ